MVKSIVIMIIGFFLLVKGADFVVKGAIGLSKKLHLSEMLIGIVLVGIGTSLPEIIVTIESSIKNESDIILGNAIGSSICNILLVIGIAGIIRPMKIDKRLCKTHLPMSLLTVIVLFAICNFGNTEKLQIDRTEALILLIMTVLYTIFTFFEGKSENKDSEQKSDSNIEKSKNFSYTKIFIYIISRNYRLKIRSRFCNKRSY